VVLGAALLLLVVALGTRGDSGSRAPSVPTSVGSALAAITVGLIAGAALAGLVALTAALTRRRWSRPRESDLMVTERAPARWATLLAALVAALAVLVVAVGAIAFLASGVKPGHPPVRPKAAGSGVGSIHGLQPSPASPLPGWAIAAGALSAGGLAAWALGASSRRPDRIPAEREASDQEAQDAAVHRAVEILTDEADPRRAVIAAYAAMERLLATAGAARNPAEAPLEYVARNPLLNSAGRAAAHRLSELFETARFSLHSVDEATRARALAALRVIAAEIDG
jgi:hypothetical protein